MDMKEEVAEDVEMTDDTETKKKKEKTKRDENKIGSSRVYIPGRHDMEEGEELECDESAYVMLHRFETKHPCLSFDPVMDKLGDTRDTFPLSCTLLAGTQADKPRDNMLMVMKLHNLHKIKQKENKEEDASSSEDEEEEEPAALLSASISHHGGVNRIRAGKGLNACAVWNDQGKVQIWNISPMLDALETLDSDNNTVQLEAKPLFTFSGHQGEGFAMDWSKIAIGKFASGDIRKNIHVWRILEGGTWAVDQKPLCAHKSSVEDLQWSPVEDDMLASCSSDGSIRLWDTRSPKGQACVCLVEKAHESDVNVISWNQSDSSLLLSGGDDGGVKVWDWKYISGGQPVAHFKHHTAPITSVQWYNRDGTVFAASGEDNQVSLWDLAVEADNEQEIASADGEEVAPQLLFIHQGQQEIKEIQWHPQLPGVIISTALDGFNIFRTISV